MRDCEYDPANLFCLQLKGFFPALILCLWQKLLTSLDISFLYCVGDKCALSKTAVLEDYLKYCTNNRNVSFSLCLLLC